MAGELQGARVLVTGSGLVGTRMVARLRCRRGEVDSGPRHLRERSPHSAAGSMPSSATSPTAVLAKEAMQGIEVVFHTAGVLEGNDVDAYHRVNHHGSEVLARAAAEAKVKRFVHVSSVAVYGYAEGDITETHPIHPKPEAYSQSKALGEQAVMRIAKETGMAAVAIRPAGVFGPGSRYFSGTFMKRALKRPIKMIGNGKGSQAVVFVDDLVDLMVTVATIPRPSARYSTAPSILHPR